MLNITLEVLFQTPGAIALLPPLLVAFAAIRRALMSKSRNFTAYSGVAMVAGVVCQVNLLFLAVVPVSVLIVSGMAVVFLWLEVRHRADLRRRQKLMRNGARLRTTY